MFGGESISHLFAFHRYYVRVVSQVASTVRLVDIINFGRPLRAS